MGQTEDGVARSLPPVTIEIMGDKYRLTCPSLGLSLMADSVERGYAAMADLIAVEGPSRHQGKVSPTPGAASAVPYGGATATAGLIETAAPAASMAGENTQTLASGFPGIRYATLAVGLVIALAIAVPLVQLLSEAAGLLQSVRQFPERVLASGEVQGGLPRALSDGLNRTAATMKDITPERRDEMRQDFKTIIEVLQPFASELRPIMEGAGLAQSCSPMQPGADNFIGPQLDSAP